MHHLVDEIERAEACCLGPKDASAPFQTFAGKGCGMELCSELLIHAKEVSNLSATHANVASWNVHIGADVLEQLRHKGLAEAHNFSVALASWREV